MRVCAVRVVCECVCARLVPDVDIFSNDVIYMNQKFTPGPDEKKEKKTIFFKAFVLIASRSGQKTKKEQKNQLTQIDYFVKCITL